MKSYWINVTNNCNLHCKYCYQTNKNEKNLTLETANQIIDLIKKEKKDGKIIFFGGEPLINFEIIKFIIDNLNQINGKKFEYSFTTNLTILTDKILQYILEQNIKVMISIDGDESTYNINRFNESNNVNYFKVVHDNIKKIELTGYDKITISKVVSLNTYKNLYEDTIFLSKFNYPIYHNFDMNIKNWNVGGNAGKIYEQQIKKLIDYYIESSDKNIIFIHNLFQIFKSLFFCI